MTPRSELLTLRNQFFALLERAAVVGAQLPDPTAIDLIDPDDHSAWDHIDRLLRQFFAIQEEIDAVLRRAQKLQLQLN
jgi:hypothetical protein